MGRWERSQRREAVYDEAEWGVRHSRGYWMRFLHLDELRYPALEVGCGASGLWRFDPNVHGLDPINYSALGGNFTLGRAESLPFEDKQFETVLCVNALDHTEDPDKAMREMSRVAKRIVLWTYVFPHGAYRVFYRPHPHALTATWLVEALAGLRKTYWAWLSPWNLFNGNSTLGGRAKLAAAEALGVRAALVHAEDYGC